MRQCRWVCWRFALLGPIEARRATNSLEEPDKVENLSRKNCRYKRERDGGHAPSRSVVKRTMLLTEIAIGRQKLPRNYSELLDIGQRRMT